MLLPIDNHLMRVADLGRGMPILMQGGWVASWDMWLPTISEMQHDWRCIAYDHRGSGASTFLPEDISAVALVDDLFRVLDALDVEQCVLAGESRGCLVVQEAALRAPDRFAGMVLVGGLARGTEVPQAWANQVVADYQAYIDGFVSACLPEPEAAGLHRWGCQTLLPAGPQAAVAMVVAQAGMAPDLENIAVPTLVVHGSLDAIVPVAHAEEAAARIPGAELVILDGAGHVPIMTRPRQVVAAIERWWDAVG